MLKLKLQYFGHLMQRDNLLEITLILVKIEGQRRKGQQMMRWIDGITDSIDMRLSKLRERVKEELGRTQQLNNNKVCAFGVISKTYLPILWSHRFFTCFSASVLLFFFLFPLLLFFLSLSLFPFLSLPSQTPPPTPLVQNYIQFYNLL